VSQRPGFEGKKLDLVEEESKTFKQEKKGEIK